jgi:hypothetical protein
MGNDECILFCRKNGYAKEIGNAHLGRKIWNEFLAGHGAKKTSESATPCLWGNTGENVDEFKLPCTAAQFEFDESILPDLYQYLSTL